jgi:hypothetical protein
MSGEIRWRLARHAMVQIAVLAWLGIAEAAPPAGKRVFIQVQGIVPVGYARAVNRDGTLIAGTACTPDLPNHPPNAFVWTAAAGTKCYTVEPPRWVPWLDPDNPVYSLYLYGVSDDGRVMGGAIQFELSKGQEESVVSFDGEPVFRRDYLRSHGYPDAFEGHLNTGRINAISPDGRMIVGQNGGIYGAVNLNGFFVILPDLDQK